MENKTDEIETPTQQAEINIPETRIPVYDPRRFINYRIRPVPYITPPLSVALGGTTNSHSTRNLIRPVMQHPTTMYVPHMVYPNVVQSYVPMGCTYRYPNNRPPPGFMSFPPGTISGVPTSFMPYPVPPPYMHPPYGPIPDHRPYSPPSILPTSHTITNSGPAICSMIATYTHINSVPVMTSMTLGCTTASTTGLTHTNTGPVVFTKTVGYTPESCVTVSAVCYGGGPVTCTVTYTTPITSEFVKTVGDVFTTIAYTTETSVLSYTNGSSLPVICTTAIYTNYNKNIGYTTTATSILSYTNGSALPCSTATHDTQWTDKNNTTHEPENDSNWTNGTTETTSPEPISKMWQRDFAEQNRTRKKTIYQGPISNTENYRNFGTLYPQSREKENETKESKMNMRKSSVTDDFEEIADIIRYVTTETVYESADSFKDGEITREENYLFYDKEFNIWKTASPKWESKCEQNNLESSPIKQDKVEVSNDIWKQDNNYNDHNTPAPYTESYRYHYPHNQWLDYTSISGGKNSEDTEENNQNVYMPQEYYIPDTSMMMYKYNEFMNNQQPDPQNSMNINYMEQNMEKISNEEIDNANNYLQNYRQEMNNLNSGLPPLDSLHINGFMNNQPYPNIAICTPYIPEFAKNICEGHTMETNTENEIMNAPTDNEVLQEQNSNVPMSIPIETMVPKTLKAHGKEYKPPVMKKVAVSKKSASIATTNTKNLKLLYKEPVEHPKKLPHVNKPEKGKKAQVAEKENKNAAKPCPKNGKNGKNKPKEEEERSKQKGKQQKSSKKK